jgi:hypothetical protein
MYSYKQIPWSSSGSGSTHNCDSESSKKRSNTHMNAYIHRILKRVAQYRRECFRQVPPTHHIEWLIVLVTVTRGRDLQSIGIQHQKVRMRMLHSFRYNKRKETLNIYGRCCFLKKRGFYIFLELSIIFKPKGPIVICYNVEHPLCTLECHSLYNLLYVTSIYPYICNQRSKI